MKLLRQWPFIAAMIIFLALILVFSCSPITDPIMGTGIWGQSKYGQAIFANGKQENLIEKINLEDKLWK